MRHAGRPFVEGERVVLYREGEKPLQVVLSNGPKMVGNFGVIDLSPAIGKEEGSTIVVAGTSFVVLRPSIRDVMATWARPTQIVTPKDAQYLLYLAGVFPGALVIEAGTGSGCLTLFLANAVGPEGRVISYDRRPEHQKVARESLERSGLLDRVTLKIADISGGFEEKGADSVLLDIPEPWEATRAAIDALHAGGYLAAYVPTYNQLERTVRNMREEQLGDVVSMELLERPLHVGEGGTRPAFEMLGHTGFLIGARKVKVANR
jgi:tRNA (adenine57-N1/adenine58-N1)-methyltransferase